MSYKEEHEAFVSGNKGSSKLQISLTVLTAILFVHLRDVLILRTRSKHYKSKRLWYSLLIDFFCIIIPIQLVLTWLNSSIIPCFISVLSLVLLLVVTDIQTKEHSEASSGLSMKDIPMTNNNRPFVTYFRAFTNILTAFSILAIDFRLFPRYLGKTETYGTGLMDVGVGCFLIANAIVSPEARQKVSSDSPVKSILKSMKSSIPMLVLGCVRVLAVKSSNYQEHVTEYGVHWNFFFTLAAVKIGCTVIFCTVPPRFWNLSGVLIMAFYQHNLIYGGLKKYIIRGQDGRGGRVDIIDANREGLYSCIGYLCVYIMGVQLGKLVLSKRSNVKEWIKVSVHLLVVCLTAWILLHFCDKKVDPVSRRFANLSYLIWMMAFNSMIIMTMLIFDIVCTSLAYIHNKAAKKESQTKAKETDSAEEEVHFPTSNLLCAVNYNGLVYFLLANLLTGAVNFLVKTMYQSDITAFMILATYMLILSVISSFLYHKKISLKFW